MKKEARSRKPAKNPKLDVNSETIRILTGNDLKLIAAGACATDTTDTDTMTQTAGSC